MPDCRYCGHEGAYDTGFSVECPNTDCEWYSQVQLREYKKSDKKWQYTQRLLSEYMDEESTYPDKTPTYHWGLDSPLIDKGED